MTPLSSSSTTLPRANPVRIASALRRAWRKGYTAADLKADLGAGIVDAADHAVVEQPEPCVGHQHQITGMGIGMVKAVAEDHFEVEVGALTSDRREFDPALG